MTFIWDNETEDRKEYLSELFEDVTGMSINSKTTQKEWREALDMVRDEADGIMTLDQTNMRNYLSGEDKYDTLVKESLKLLKDKKKELTQRRKEIIKKEISFKKVKGQTYLRGDKKIPAFQNGKKVKATPERYLRDGKIDVRLRTDKGTLASFV